MINERADVSSGRDRLVYSMHLSEAAELGAARLGGPTARARRETSRAMSASQRTAWTSMGGSIETKDEGDRA